MHEDQYTGGTLYKQQVSERGSGRRWQRKHIAFTKVHPHHEAPHGMATGQTLRYSAKTRRAWSFACLMRTANRNCSASLCRNTQTAYGMDTFLNCVPEPPMDIASMDLIRRVK